MDASAATLTHRRSKLLTDVSGKYQWSLDLQNWHGSGDTASGVTVTIADTVIDGSDPDFDVVEAAATATPGLPGKIFLRISVEQMP